MVTGSDIYGGSFLVYFDTIRHSRLPQVKVYTKGEAVIKGREVAINNTLLWTKKEKYVVPEKYFVPVKLMSFNEK